MLNRRSLLQGSAALPLIAGSRAASAQSATVPAGYPANYAAIIEGSRSEPPLIVYSSISNEEIAPQLARLRTLYPWIRVQHLENSGAGVIERYQSDVGTNAATASLLLAPGADGWLRMVERNQIVDYRSPEAPNFLPAEMPHPGLHRASNDPIVFVWNKLLLPPALRPTGFADLAAKVAANPRVFNGKISGYSASLTGFGYNVIWHLAQRHGEAIWDWYRVLAPQTKFERSTGTVMEKVLAGEYVLGYYVASKPIVAGIKNSRDVAGVLETGVMSDGTLLFSVEGAITAAGRSPNSAKLLLDSILSKPGQVALAKVGSLPARTDLTAADVDGWQTMEELIRKVGGAQNIFYTTSNPKMLTDYQPFINRWNAMTGGR
jgi:iron(III) transport system substrate-binding protein